jgi:eukaryotic-like serine/threonine-protein kinase
MNEKTLFREALSRSPEERVAFLDQVCAGQPELLAAVEALLVAPENSGKVLDRADAAFDHAPGPDDASSAVTETTEFVTRSASGNVIAGRFTLQEKIGEGGMGEVWAAKQTEPVKRKVALKLIKTGMDSRAVLQRFEQERQALAMMDHPNIARALDGGLTPTGQPFFVMELVNGLPLNKFCDEARLTPRERLRLFVPICQAVQHAHQKGVVHRDLKPANILVTMIDGKPVPKVIDFGVAKAIAGKLTDESMSTLFGAVIGTFEYMSPEQAGFSGADVDTRADIYSLGVILYELLTGLRPFDARRLRNAALTEMLRMIQEEEPSKPSTRLSTDESLPSMAALRQTEPRKLMAMLRGELDWVVMKCLEKHRERRYETANALAHDIQRYVADEAVEARPPSAVYRFSKFLRRHRGPVLAASLVLLALVGGIVGTTIGMIQAEQRRVEADKARGREAARAEGERLAREQEAVQRAKAEKARDRARQALDAMTSSVAGDSLATQLEISDEQKKFLTEVLTYYQEFAGEKADDESSRARTAGAAFRVGLIEGRLGRTAEAAAANRLAVDGYATLAAEFPGVPEYRNELGGSHNNLGLVLTGLGKRPEAEEQYRKALAIREKQVAEFPTVLEHRKNMARSQDNLGNLLAGLGKRPEAEEQYRKALAIREKLVAEFPTVPEHRVALAASHSNLGNLRAGLGKGPEAEQRYRKALAIEEELVAEFPAVPLYRRDLGRIHGNLGILLAGLGKGPEAEERYRKALAIREKLVTDFPAVPEYRQDLAASHNRLGYLLAGRGKGPEAEEQYRKALPIQEKLVAEFPAVPEYRKDLALSRNNLGAVLAGPEAGEQYRKALAIRETLVAEFPAVRQYRVELGGSYCNFGISLMNSGQPGESLVWFEKAIRTLSAVHEQDRQLVEAGQFLRNSHGNRAMAYDRLRRFTEAIKDRDKAIELSPAAEQPRFRAARATSRLQAGQMAEAVAEIAELTQNPKWNSGQWYDFACVYAVASGKRADKKQEYADRAMDLLQKAVKAGWSDAAHMVKDTDLDPIRGREDFKKLIEEMTKKSPAEPEQKR